MLDFRLETFLAVCQTMNFTAAAQRLHITQPAVSQHIHWLEQTYGTPLFHREGKKIALTPSGELVRRTAMAVQNDHKAMVRMLSSVPNVRKTLVFGVTLTIGTYAIVPSLARYLHAHPHMDVYIHYGNTHQLLTQLQEGTIDFALVEGYFPAQDYDTFLWGSQPYIPVCAAHHVFSHPVHTLSDLLSQRLLVRESGSGTREILEKYLALHNLSIEDFSSIVQVEQIHTIVDLLVADCGISFLYQAAVQKELDAGVLRKIPLDDGTLSHDFTFLWNKGSCFAPEYQEICRELCPSTNQMPAPIPPKEESQCGDCPCATADPGK